MKCRRIMARTKERRLILWRKFCGQVATGYGNWYQLVAKIFALNYIVKKVSKNLMQCLVSNDINLSVGTAKLFWLVSSLTLEYSSCGETWILLALSRQH